MDDKKKDSFLDYDHKDRKDQELKENVFGSHDKEIRHAEIPNTPSSVDTDRMPSKDTDGE